MLQLSYRPALARPIHCPAAPEIMPPQQGKRKAPSTPNQPPLAPTPPAQHDRSR
ncbi:MAG TPA: hypothetical protein VFU49_09530 [Ktedonobacteraceae bacterium]|nr:hypothetical protein [Ktedonobacteraceae bacterium]